MLLYCNSDSMGVMSDTDNRYSEFLGNLIGAKSIINNGLPGSCNARIIRTTVRDILDIRSTNNDTMLAVICLSASMIRGEWWNPDIILPEGFKDGHFESFHIHGPNATDRKHPLYNYTKEWYRVYNDEAEQTNLLKELVMLTSFFKQQKVEYIIFVGHNFTYKPVAYDDVFLKTFSSQIFADPNILNINEFSFTKFCLDCGHVPFDHKKYGDHGHHGEEGHREFADFLFKHYTEQKL